MKKIFSIILLFSLLLAMSGCAMFDSQMMSVKGDLIGQSYIIDTFSNYGELSLRTEGDKINITPNIVEEKVFNDGSWGYVETLSSAITINIDGNQMVSCGDTCVFYSKDLKPDYDFHLEEINSNSNGFADNTIISGTINSVKNSFGKPVVVVIKSQMGSPIYAFSGKDVYWEIPDNLPKMTMFSIDGKRLYIHRANYQIIDTALIQ